MSNAERIRRRRALIGKSTAEVAALVGLSTEEYDDLEAYHDELETVPSLATVARLAEVLGVSTCELFIDAKSEVSTAHVSYAELAQRIRAILRNGTTQASLEEEVGWSLDQFLAGETEALANYPVDALMDICGPIGVNWIAALP